jgi:hypothetical protein
MPAGCPWSRSPSSSIRRHQLGRLTLNVLLSFAQFEREVTGERIRDQIAASKQKGMWMGGLVPICYDVIDRRLAVNQTEAETVREIFRRYLKLGSVRLLMEEPARSAPKCGSQGMETDRAGICEEGRRVKRFARALLDPARQSVISANAR